MAETGTTFVGLPGNLALWRLLDLKGIPMQLTLLEETLAEDFSVEAMVLELNSRGIATRQVRIQPDELDHLEVPTLVQLENTFWVLLRERVGSTVLIEQGTGGTERVSLGELGPSLNGTALDVSAALADHGGLFSRLIRLIPAQGRFLVQAALASLVLQGIALATPQLTRVLVDTALPQGAHATLTILTLGLLVLALSRAWVGWLRDQTTLALTARLDATVQKGLFEQILWLPFRDVQKRSRGELLQAFMGLSVAQRRVLGQGLGVLLDGLLAVVTLAWMLALLPGASVLVILVALVMSLLSLGGGFLGARVQAQEIHARSAQRSFLVELLGGVATLKATGTLDWGLERWLGLFTRERRITLGRERLESWFSLALTSLQHAMGAALLIWGGHAVLHGQLALGAFLAFLQLSTSFTASLQGLTQTTLLFVALKPQVEEVRRLFLAPRAPRPPRKPPARLPGPVVVEDVWFRYAEDAPWVLQGANLRVELGAFHQVRGPSGSGKSTLLKLLAGLYAPDTGRISLGGLDAPHASRFMTYLPQFTQLLGGSIRENLDYFSGGASLEQLQEIAAETGLADWVATLPMGYQTMVSTGGDNLSGGQRQLISLTAVLASSRTLLILDEAMSNLDWLTRRRILDSPRFRGRTVIYASHEELLA